jgi:transposase-like protein
MGKFPNEKAAIEHFEKVRWKGQPVCPRCNSNFRQYERKSPERAGYFLCKNCNNEYTVRTGTVFERSHIPLHKWFLAMHLVDDSRKGISSVQLSKALGIIQRSSWFLQQRMRETFSDGKMNLLKNEVEADEAHFGGLEKNKHASKKLNAGRGAVGKKPVLGIRERNGNVKGIVLKDTSAKTIQGELNKWVDKDATLYTDEHKAYTNNKFNHKTAIIRPNNL